jgi:ATP-binding cassette subfamily B protein
MQSGGLISAAPVLGAFAMGAQRLMPLSQGIYTGWSSIRASHESLKESIAILRLDPIANGVDTELSIKQLNWSKLELNNINFQYSDISPLVISDISLNIDKGSCIGFIGKSGSGKSTLLDIIMGLLAPTNGTIEVDGQAMVGGVISAWQSQIAHIPQDIFLSDSTVMENIAFGIAKSDINMERVKTAAKKAQLESTINGWPHGYLTKVGERGIQLSGGQKQRIGIARALYKDADLLIFDEATNSLDFETEKCVMDAVENLRKDFTILIVAHRLNTLAGCSKIVEISNGRIIHEGTFAELAKTKF